MSRSLVALSLAALMFAPLTLVAPSSAQDAAKPKAKVVAAAGPKLAKGQKLCQYKFPDGEKRSWACDKEQPCCAWDAIKYVKCGSTITKCL